MMKTWAMFCNSWYSTLQICLQNQTDQKLVLVSNLNDFSAVEVSCFHGVFNKLSKLSVKCNKNDKKYCLLFLSTEYWYEHWLSTCKYVDKNIVNVYVDKWSACMCTVHSDTEIEKLSPLYHSYSW